MKNMKSTHFPSPVADDMVRAILEDRKTVTRRVVKPQPKDVHRVLYGPLHKNATTVGFDCGWKDDDPRTGYVETVKLPYRPGDILYVRETFFKYAGEYVYKASVAMPKLFDGMWHPSVHMSREAARIFLQVIDVRVERLQDITPEQAIKEGVIDPANRPYIQYEQVGQLERYARNKVFPQLWDSTIKKADCALYGWEANPWVFVISFERIAKEEAEYDQRR